ncbi:MAG: DegV family protein [Chloroflexi bacterium]|nr:DegV family protein [Chloroflexota bacterium]
MSIRIVTDSTCDIPRDLAEEHGITIVPASVFFGDEHLLDGVDIDSDTFFERLARESQLPTTSQPSPGAFRDVYQQLKDEGATEILSLHVSEKLSGTLASARQGAQQVEGVRIETVDSESATLALGLGAITAAEAVAAGASLDEARDRVLDQFERTENFLLVDTLEYLRRGGRIGRAQEMLGGLMRVKPLLAIQDGVIVPVGRVRTKKKAVAEVIRRTAALGSIEQLAVLHSTTPDEAADLASRLGENAPGAPVMQGQVGPAIGVHVGPGLLAVVAVLSPVAAAA